MSVRAAFEQRIEHAQGDELLPTGLVGAGELDARTLVERVEDDSTGEGLEGAGLSRLVEN